MKKNSHVDSVLKIDKSDIITDNFKKADLFNLLFAENSTLSDSEYSAQLPNFIFDTQARFSLSRFEPHEVFAVLNKVKSRKRSAVGDTPHIFFKKCSLSRTTYLNKFAFALLCVLFV